MEVDSKMFPEPWLSAYYECKKIPVDWGNFDGDRMIWFGEWLKNDPVLPKISMEAIKIFAKMVSYQGYCLYDNYCDSTRKHVTKQLSSYLKISAKSIGAK